MQVYTASGDTTAADTTDAARLSRLSTANLVWAESHLYGSNRLGLLNQYVSAESRSGGGVVYETRGYKFFELANHLGNVLGVITDKKMAHTTTGTTVDYYNPDIVNVADYYPFGMPSRSAYLGTVSLNYRYTFNGKENDADVKGDGDQIDYGARIYDPRLGRFLSRDPLSKGYPALTPYQYASNNPIEGFDVDGREYMSSKEARIEVVWGKVGLKIDNMHTVTKNILKEYHENTQNWAPNQIGADLSVGSIILKGVGPSQRDANINTLDNTYGAPDPSFLPGKSEIENPKTKGSDYTVPDRCFKDRTVSSATPAGSKGFAIASIAIDLSIMGSNLYIQNRIDDDQSMVNKSLSAFKLAAADVNYALNKGLIPKGLQTTQYLSDIINVVLSGTSVVNDYDKKTGAKVLELGKKIYNTLSIKRLPTLGPAQERSQMDNYSNRIQVENPGYDPDYIKQNPPLK